MTAAPRLWLMALLCGAVLACDPAEDIEPLVCKNPDLATAHLGIGDKKTGFVAVQQGDPVTVVLGPQGLHMVVLSVRLDGFELPSVGGSRTRMRAAVREGGKVVAGAVEAAASPALVDEERVEFLGIRATFQAEEVDPFDGVMVDVSITVRDGCGRDVRASDGLRLSVPSAD